MKTLHLKTPLGSMIAVADDFGLYILDFEDNPDLPKMMVGLEKIEHVILDRGDEGASDRGPIHYNVTGSSYLNSKKHSLKTINGSSVASYALAEDDNSLLSLVQKELQAYFEGTLTNFTVPLAPQGTVFQKCTWSALSKVPYGTTQSYADIATSINQPAAFRAVANANGVNPIAIIIPCHRIIKSSGDLCGYRGGIDRKQWLLAHEERYFA